jgi:hypothetical protein
VTLALLSPQWWYNPAHWEALQPANTVCWRVAVYAALISTLLAKPCRLQESQLRIEYVPAVVPPEAKQALPHDDWCATCDPSCGCHLFAEFAVRACLSSRAQIT